MARSSSNGTKRSAPIPAGAWHVMKTVWGEAQQVRLITGPPSLVEDAVHVRSIHLVGFLNEGRDLLLVQNRDGTFSFPGGRLEGGESLENALQRELWEEARAHVRPDYQPVAVTRIEFLNRLPDRVYRVHPTYLLWVAGEIALLADEPCHDPAPGGVLGRCVCCRSEAVEKLGELERRVLDAATAVIPICHAQG